MTKTKGPRHQGRDRRNAVSFGSPHGPCAPCTRYFLQSTSCKLWVLSYLQDRVLSGGSELAAAGWRLIPVDRCVPNASLVLKRGRRCRVVADTRSKSRGRKSPVAVPPTTRVSAKLLAIMTVVPEASDAVRRAFDLRRDPSDPYRSYWTGSLNVPNGASLEIVECQTSDRSNIPAAITAYQLILDKKPDYLFVVDIGGAFVPSQSTPVSRTSAARANGVIASLVHYYEYLRRLGTGRRPCSILPCSLRTRSY